MPAKTNSVESKRTSNSVIRQEPLSLTYERGHPADIITARSCRTLKNTLSGPPSAFHLFHVSKLREYSAQASAGATSANPSRASVVFHTQKISFRWSASTSNSFNASRYFFAAISL